MNAFLDLLFPARSLVGGGLLAEGESYLTMQERLVLPLTHLGTNSQALLDRFAEKCEMDFASAFLWFSQGTSTQALIHQLKYHDRPGVGELLGTWFGQYLKGRLPPVDLLLPVPLDPKRKRAYNQAAHVAMGLSAELGILWRDDVLYKTESTGTQTQKTADERLLSLKGKFALREGDSVEGKRIALVDDVLTTGSTLASCALVLKEAGAAAVGALTLGATR